VEPTCSIARWALSTSGRLIVIWSVPRRATSGSETPNWSIRSRMISIARSMSSPVTSFTCPVGCPW
jgi:hypothetical protein